MTMPQQPGYPAFPPTYQQPQPAPAQAPALPWQQPQPQAPQPFLPQQQPPAQVPGYGPPVMGPPMQPPPGYPPQQPAYQAQNHWQGADRAQLQPRSADIPLGNHLFEWISLSRSRTSGQKDMCFIKLKIVASDNQAAINTECAMKQNMNPPGNGGSNIAFNALAKLVFPALGYDIENPAHKAQIDAFLAQEKLSKWLLELECTNSVEGRPVAGRQFTGQITAGRRTEKTPPGKEPFPFTNYKPYMPPILG